MKQVMNWLYFSLMLGCGGAALPMRVKPPASSPVPEAKLSDFPVSVLGLSRPVSLRSRHTPQVRVTHQEDGTEIANIALSGPVECRATRERVDPTFWILDSKAPELDVEGAPHIEVTTVGSRPVLWIDMPAKKEDPQHASTWGVSVGNNASVGCVTRDPGGANLLRENLGPLLLHIESELPKKPALHYVWTLQERGRVIGASELRVEEEEGGINEQSYQTLFTKAANKLSVLEFASWRVIDKKGAMVREVQALAMNGHLVTRMTIARDRGDRFTVSGTCMGKDVDSAFSKPMSSSTSRAKRMRELKMGGQFTYHEFDCLPDGPRLRTFRVRATAPNSVTFQEDGEEDSLCATDAFGICTRITQGPHDTSLVERWGTLP